MSSGLDIQNFGKLKAHLNRIAKANKEKFETCVTWTEKGYVLEVKRNRDRHTILSVDGPVIFVIIDKAFADLKVACKSCGYEYVD